MKSGFTLCGIVLLAVLQPVSLPLCAQLSSEIRITVKDDVISGDSARMIFGNHINGTYGRDSLNPTLKEINPPPDGYGFNALWIDIPGRMNSHGNGFIKYDIRGFTSQQQTDTFRILFGNADEPEANFTFRWADPAYLARRCDSMIMIEPHGFMPRVDMFAQDSLYLESPGLTFDKVMIIKYGCNIIDGVGEDRKQKAAEFSLSQNYPNPFNGMTGIRYRVSDSRPFSLRIYDVLGNEIRTLVEGRKGRGEYTVRWNAEGLPSGVYIYCLQAGMQSVTRKMLLIR